MILFQQRLTILSSRIQTFFIPFAAITAFSCLMRMLCEIAHVSFTDVNASESTSCPLWGLLLQDIISYLKKGTNILYFTAAFTFLKVQISVVYQKKNIKRKKKLLKHCIMESRRIMESPRSEKSSKIIQSSHPPSTSISLLNHVA